jgi:hypothetical protein
LETAQLSMALQEQIPSAKHSQESAPHQLQEQRLVLEAPRHPYLMCVLPDFEQNCLQKFG